MGVRPGTRSPHTGTEFKQRSGGELLKTFFFLLSVMDLFGWGSFCLSCLVFTNFETRSPSLGKDAKSADAEATQRDDNL